MKDKSWFLNTALAAVLGAALLVCILLRTFMPAVILPKLDIPNMVLLSLAALVLNHYLARGAKFCRICTALLAAVTFGLLPFAAGFATLAEAAILAALGGVCFAITAWLYTSVQERLSSGPAAKAAPVFSALGLYLAAQCFCGILL